MPEEPEQRNTEKPDDQKTNDVVDDIVAKESDELLQAEDEKKLAEAFSDKKQTWLDKIKHFVSVWWNTPKYRWGSIAGAATLLLILSLIPPTRYFMLNTVGVRASASVTILDESTTQPLKNVTVKLSGKSAQTDNEGKAKISKVKLGRTDLIVEKRAFAATKKKVTIGLGSNPLGEVKLTPTGTQYSFRLTDFLSDKPITRAEAVSGEFSAFSDKEGKIVLNIDKTDDNDIDITISAQDYRTESISRSADDLGEQNLKLAPAKKHLFISKRHGRFDVYKIDADGKNEELTLAGTGSERDDMALASHPTEAVAALVSTREKRTNKDGFLLSTLTLIDVNGGAPKSLVTSERIQLVDWIDSRLVYVKISEGTSGDNPGRHKLMSYDFKTSDTRELASANYFNDVLSAGNAIYFAPSAAYQSAANIGLFHINADGTNKKTILSGEVWNLLRASFERLNISTASGWYDYKLGDSTAVKISSAPSDLRSKLYKNSPDNILSLWTEERDGKGTLLIYEISSGKDEAKYSRRKLTAPLYWLSNKHIVFRVNDDRETADYIINLEGGEPKKIRDVTNTSGIDNWYYY